MLTRRAIAVTVALTTSLVLPGAVGAQGGTGTVPAEVRRPYRGLFGAPPAPDSKQSLLLTASAFAAYDDNVLDALAGRRVTSPWLQQSGQYQGANAGLGYTFNADGERADLRGHVDGQVQYYRHPDRSDVSPYSAADVVFSTRLTRSLTFDLRESVSYTSNYNARVISDLGEVEGHDIGVVDLAELDLFPLRALRTATTVNLRQGFGRHVSLLAAYHFRSAEVQDNDDAPENSRFSDYRTHAGTLKAQYQRPMTRYARLDLGYGIRMSDRQSGTGQPRTMHLIDAGVDYGRPLSISRRTSLSFGTGSAITVSDQVGATDAERRTRARLTGHATLSHELGRTWNATLGYTRGFRTREGFEDLFFTDAVSAGFGGLMTRRWSFATTAGWADSSREDGRGGGQRGGYATAQTQFALSRWLALYARYTYLQYRFREDTALDDRLPRQLDRHGVRVGLTTSVPLIR